ncbi:MAG: hypothetical protein FWH52_02915 [Synergistaceae bacterium]|nr:hypothetical protein [Synergistaceae bacterium]
MSFTLFYSKGRNVSGQTLTDPSPEIIEEVINELLPTLDYYVLLERRRRNINLPDIETQRRKALEKFKQTDKKSRTG